LNIKGPYIVQDNECYPEQYMDLKKSLYLLFLL